MEEMKERLYLRELPIYQNATESQKKAVGKNPYYDLELLPSQTMREEMTEFLKARSNEVLLTTIYKEKQFYSQICSFIQLSGQEGRNMAEAVERLAIRRKHTIDL